MSNEMDDAGLDDSLRKNRIDSLRKTLQVINDCDEDILSAAGL